MKLNSSHALVALSSSLDHLILLETCFVPAFLGKATDDIHYQLSGGED